MSKTFTVDLFFNQDNQDTRISIAQRKKDIPKLFAERIIPLYGTFGNSLNRHTVDSFNLSEEAVDFIVKSIDVEAETAEIEWIRTNFVPESFENINLCLAYKINKTNVTGLRFGFMQYKIQYTHQLSEIQPDEHLSPTFDFSVALRLMKEGKALSRMAWGQYSLTFVSFTPGTENLPQEKFWSPCNALAVGLLSSKTADVLGHYTMFTDRTVTPYTFTNADLNANDWCLNKTILNGENKYPVNDVENGPEITTIHTEELVEK